MSRVQFLIINIGTLSMNKYWDEKERKRSASSTSTLLEIDKKRILVDPSPNPDVLEQQLFATSGLKPGDIDLIFITHFHGDHRFGLELFNGKPWFMAADGISEWLKQSPDEKPLIERFSQAPQELAHGITLIPTPGHTYGHHSLLVDSEWGKLVVAGDSVMTRDFFDAEDGFHNSVDFSLVKKTIQMIKQKADLVIPGHGNIIINKR